MREGVPNFFATLIEVLQDRNGPSPEVEPKITSGDYLSGFLLGTRQALYENQRDSITLTISQVNARSVGAMIALYERAVGFYGFLVNINAYHQPGVEAGKKAAAAVLELQKQVVAVLQSEGKALTLEALADKAGASDRVEEVYKIVRHLAANQRGVQLQGNFSQPSNLKVSAV
jgi:glucose-6-phosphate isomerase